MSEPVLIHWIRKAGKSLFTAVLARRALWMKRYGLPDDPFARIEGLLSGRPGSVGRSSDRGNRRFVEAVIWKFSSGAPWRDLPERFGGWQNTHTRFSRWAASGVWDNLFKALADDPDTGDAMIDFAPLERRIQRLRVDHPEHRGICVMRGMECLSFRKPLKTCSFARLKPAIALQLVAPPRTATKLATSSS